MGAVIRNIVTGSVALVVCYALLYLVGDIVHEFSPTAVPRAAIGGFAVLLGSMGLSSAYVVGRLIQDVITGEPE